MPLGGKLLLKGGVPLTGVEKKKKKKSKQLNHAAVDDLNESGSKDVSTSAPDGQPQKPKAVDPTAINVMSGKRYEEEFEFETLRVKEGKTRSNPWGSSYRAPPTILHGYSKPVTGKTAGERLDLRAAAKADRYCK